MPLIRCTSLAILLLLACAPDAVRGNELLQRVVEAAEQQPLADDQAWHLRMRSVEQLHVNIELPLEIELWWTPDGYLELQRYRQWLVHAKLWDGEALLFAEDRRVRYPLALDVAAFRQSQEAMEVSRLLPLLEPDAPWRITAQEKVLRVRSLATGTLYTLQIDPRTYRIRSISYPVRSLYGGDVSTRQRTVEYSDYRRTDGGELLAHTVRVLEDGQQLQEFQVIEAGVVPAPAFTLQALEQRLASHPPFPGETTEAERALLAATGKALATGAERWEQLRAGPAFSLLDPQRYAAGLLEEPAFVLVAPDRMEPHTSAHFMPMDVDTRGQPRLNMITLRDEPMRGVADFLTLLHEASHLLIRQHQVEAPILAVDDEDLVAWQEDSVHLLGNLQAFEEVAFADPRPGNYRDESRRRWGRALLRYRYGMSAYLLGEAELAQFEQITGFRLRMQEIRRHYLSLGIDPELMPMQMLPRFDAMVEELRERQKALRKPWQPYAYEPPPTEPSP